MTTQTHIHIANATLHFTPLGLDITPLPVREASPDRAAAAPASTPVHAKPPMVGEYWHGQGGIYLGTLGPALEMPARHLIAAASDAPHKLKWGEYDEVSGAASQVNGLSNTLTLAGRGVGAHPAALYCRDYTADGHHDFFLPSRLDMVMAYIMAPRLFVKDGWYWTSTQSSRYGAFAQDFEYGGSYWTSKFHELRVRAFRWIPVTA